MGAVLSYMDVKRQSEAVWGQFGESKWIPYSQINVRLPNRRDPEELRGCGIGKFAVLAAMGASLEDHVEVIKKYRDRFDLVTCDKGFGVLLDRGIRADYVQLCDCNIPYRWLEPYVGETAGVKLLATTYANVEWTTKWKGPIYFYVNKDALRTEERFTPILGKPDLAKLGFCPSQLRLKTPEPRSIPAGSNVSNAMVIFMMGIDESNQVSFSGYENLLLTGYDYSWRPSGSEAVCKTGNYYAFADPRPKRHYMNHRTILDLNGDPVHTSENLLFSAKWLYSYVTAFGLPVTNCSERGILDIPGRGKLGDMLRRINNDPAATARVRKDVEMVLNTRAVAAHASESLDQSRRALWL